LNDAECVRQRWRAAHLEGFSAMVPDRSNMNLAERLILVEFLDVPPLALQFVLGFLTRGAADIDRSSGL
jgi:hypothetical protein